ncbi:amine oxidase [Nakamurella flava]|uniref:Amine oxidase n=1 Tax=Nakamurella flava TaxID=2576308 RepID=A0A4U6QAS2_9ACTN|nr:AQJ64_40280 family protein [Nakamurella flava]TKV57050.1 amine oxidase [Nakamurella flava]
MPAPPDRAAIGWVDARRRQPRDGQLVLAAITGRYPPEPGRSPSPDDDFWLVLPMHFCAVHVIEPGDPVLHDCYLDADRVVRFPAGSGHGGEEVTHWATLPGLPGRTESQIVGAAVGPALAAAVDPTGPDAPSG